MRVLKYEGNRPATVFDKIARQDRTIKPGESKSFPDDVAEWLLAHEPTLWSDPSPRTEEAPEAPPEKAKKAVQKRKADK